MDRFCLPLLLSELEGQDVNEGRVFTGLEEEMDPVDRLLNFFFTPSLTLSSDLTWRIFV